MAQSSITTKCCSSTRIHLTPRRRASASSNSSRAHKSRRPVEMRPLNFFAVCAALVLLTGCAGYHFGPVNDAVAGEKSVEVLPFNNQTLQPRLGDAVTQALRERLQVDGTYDLAMHDDGDIVVTGVITHYSREGTSY